MVLGSIRSEQTRFSRKQWRFLPIMPKFNGVQAVYNAGVSRKIIHFLESISRSFQRVCLAMVSLTALAFVTCSSRAASLPPIGAIGRTDSSPNIQFKWQCSIRLWPSKHVRWTAVFLYPRAKKRKRSHKDR